MKTFTRDLQEVECLRINGIPVDLEANASVEVTQYTYEAVDPTYSIQVYCRNTLVMTIGGAYRLWYSAGCDQRGRHFEPNTLEIDV